MKIVLPNYDKQAIGGGWSWIANFRKIMNEIITDDYNRADIYLVPSASMASRDEVLRAKGDGKKIVLRCDNIIRNSRNRNTGMSRMKDFAEWADLVVFQSKFAKRLLAPYLMPKNAVVILNSIDQGIFNTDGRDGKTDFKYLYSKYSTDETKNWEMARLAFQMVPARGKTLTLVGRFDSNLEEYNFDFYEGEKVNYLGLISQPENMAKIYKTCDKFLYSYFNDACSNTALESLSSGLEIHDCYGMTKTGGMPEIMAAHEMFGIEYFALDRMGKEYTEALERL